MNAKMQEQSIAECVAAMDMLREQICGMYALLAEQRNSQVQCVEQVNQSLKNLERLTAKLPNDLMTLASIQGAAVTVKDAIATMPDSVVLAAKALKEYAAREFAVALLPHLQRMECEREKIEAMTKDMKLALRTYKLSIACCLVLGGLVAGAGLNYLLMTKTLSHAIDNVATNQVELYQAFEKMGALPASVKRK